jgi:formate-dependent phosphoribosylglycinamide formyltransferase (GAR transformylase)
MKKQSVLILGGGPDQKLLVEEFNQRGFRTIIADYYEYPPAKKISDLHYQVSTYDMATLIQIARKEKVSLVTTISTDQPIKVAADISEQLCLPFQISSKQAQEITNKKWMKIKLSEHKVPTAPFIIAESERDLDSANKLNYPLIMKPVDSSGSRGVFVLENEQFLREHYCQSKEHSSTSTVIIEEFIDGQEISVDAIITNKTAVVLSITDGFKTYSESQTPLYNQNTFSSGITKTASLKVSEICTKIAEAFQIGDSPLFVQMIVHNDDVNVIEFSARIAGGSKPYFIPLVSGVNLVSSYVDQLLNEKVKIVVNQTRDSLFLNHIYGKGGIYMGFQNVDQLINQNYIEKFIEYQIPGSSTRAAHNGSDRIGAFIVRGKNHVEASKKVQFIDSNLNALDEKGNDIMMHNLFKK